MNFIQNLNWRYATKSFNKDKKISEDNLAKIRNAINMAPTSYGLQPFHVVELVDSDMRKKVRGISYNQAQITDSDRVFVFIARTDIKDRITDYINLVAGDDLELREKLAGVESTMRNSLESLPPDILLSWAAKQAYIALSFGLAACAELEIDSCPMEGFDREKLNQLLELPDYMKSQAFLAVGYRSDSDIIRQKIRFGESELFKQI